MGLQLYTKPIDVAIDGLCVVGRWTPTKLRTPPNPFRLHQLAVVKTIQRTLDLSASAQQHQVDAVNPFWHPDYAEPTPARYGYLSLTLGTDDVPGTQFLDKGVCYRGIAGLLYLVRADVVHRTPPGCFTNRLLMRWRLNAADYFRLRGQVDG